MVVASLRQDRRGCPLPPVRLLIFPSQGVRKISFKQFRKALELLAAEKGVAKGKLWRNNAIWVSLVALWSLPPLLPLLARSPNQRCSVVNGFPPFPLNLLAEDLFAQVAACAGPTLNCITTPEAVDPESGRLVACSSASPTAAGVIRGGSGLAGAAFGSGSSSGGWGSEKGGRPISAGSGSVDSAGEAEEAEEAEAGAELASPSQQAQQAEHELQAGVAKL